MTTPDAVPLTEEEIADHQWRAEEGCDTSAASLLRLLATIAAKEARASAAEARVAALEKAGDAMAKVTFYEDYTKDAIDAWRRARDGK